MSWRVRLEPFFLLKQSGARLARTLLGIHINLGGKQQNWIAYQGFMGHIKSLQNCWVARRFRPSHLGVFARTPGIFPYSSVINSGFKALDMRVQLGQPGSYAHALVYKTRKPECC